MSLTSLNFKGRDWGKKNFPVSVETTYSETKSAEPDDIQSRVLKEKADVVAKPHHVQNVTAIR